MAADVWLRFKGSGKGRYADSWYYRGRRLLTKDATEARARARLVDKGEWPPPDGRAPVTAAAVAFSMPEPPPAPPESPPPAADPPPAPAAGPTVTGEWTHAATGAAAEGTAPPETPAPEVSNEQLADFLVSLELTIVEIYTRKKIYEGFVAPEIAPAGRAMLAGSYKAILDYGGSQLQLPPWVQGLVVPGIAVVVSSQAIAAGFADAARDQKKKAESGGG